MSVIVFDLPLMRMAGFRNADLESPWYERLTVVGIVVLAHLMLFAFWLAQPEAPKVAINELSISFTNIQRQQADIAPQPEIKPESKPKLRVVEPEAPPESKPKLRVAEPEAPHVPEPVVQEETPPAPTMETPPSPVNSRPRLGWKRPAPTMETPPSPVQLDAEPDYRADYLNNPKPPYPMLAQRMGYQGKVVLNVEVLGEGRAGEIKLHSSSGYDILDKAALQTVKTWKFAPARRFGQPVTQWFLVPIKFSLEE